MEEITKKECFDRHESLNENLGKNFTEIKLSIAELPEKILEKSAEKFASKLTEKIVYGLCGFILLAFLAAVTGLVVYAKY
jgi:hypothetical protein